MGIIKPKGQYEHPRKKKTIDRDPSAKPIEKIEPINAVKEKTDIQKTGKPVSVSKDNHDKTETVTIRLVVRPPRPRQIKMYDDMIDAGLSPKEAILGILKKSIQELDNTKATHLKDANYSHKGTAISTRRTISVDIFEKLKAKFDPFDILSERGFGIKVGEALMVYMSALIEE